MSMELEFELVTPLLVAPRLVTDGRSTAPIRVRTAPHPMRRFLTLQGISQAADAATTVALAQVVVFSLENGATPATVIRALLIGAVPFILALPVAGLISDRCARRRTLAGVQVLRSLLTLAAVAVPLTRSASLGYAFVVALLAASGLANFLRSASLPHVADPQRLVQANSWSSLVAKLAGLIGMGVAVVIGRTHPAPFLVGTATMHMVAAIGYGTWRCDFGGRVAAGQMIRFAEIRQRASALVASDPARTPVRAALGHRMLQGATMMLFVQLAEGRFHLGGTGYAIAIGATAVGTFLGTVVTSPLLNRHGAQRTGVLAWTAAAFGLVIAALATRSFTAVAALVVVGASFQIARLLADSTVQLAVIDDALGRVFSLYDASFHAALLAGATAAYFVPGLGSALALLGLALVHAAAGLFRHRSHRVSGKD